MNTATTTWPGPSIVQPTIERPTAMRLAKTEYQRVTDAADALQPEDWTRPTDCTDWDVRQLVAHIAGQTNLFSTPFEVTRQMRAAKARQQPGQAEVDALTAFQVEERKHLRPEQLRAELHRVGPRGAKGRRRVPGFIRRRRLPGTEIFNGMSETWSVGYLTDVILTRDPWMHRLDLARATGRDPVLTADHDGVIVADVVAEWARRHGRPFRLELTGPAGGSWSSGRDGEEIVMDAADFCRVISGRPSPDGGRPPGLLTTQVPF
ncbi:MAG TPA: maleylpyruvate isomerase family mycothiol-dependent enzyme [Propionibacteriaceae bacterium]